MSSLVRSRTIVGAYDASREPSKRFYFKASDGTELTPSQFREFYPTVGAKFIRELRRKAKYSQ